MFIYLTHLKKRPSIWQKRPRIRQKRPHRELAQPYVHLPGIRQKETYHTSKKRPIVCQKRPIVCQKRPIVCQKRSDNTSCASAVTLHGRLSFCICTYHVGVFYVLNSQPFGSICSGCVLCSCFLHQKRPILCQKRPILCQKRSDKTAMGMCYVADF